MTDFPSLGLDFPANAILWTANVEVPKDGCPSPTPNDSQIEENLDGKKTFADYMTTDAICYTEDTDAIEICKFFINHHIRVRQRIECAYGPVATKNLIRPLSSNIRATPSILRHRLPSTRIELPMTSEFDD